MNIKIARIKKGYTQKELSRILRISPNKMVKIDKGDYTNTTYPLMVKLAEVLDSTPYKLFFSKEEK
ncbi:helix-turn-helix transcriptional regulator [Clostridium sp.]|uniref:helix-turn-helix transcriptional regulator n=1 Tax=Clostridium sp. TaxID=1506 RepID=UPI002635630A|nr:helix-turn-helix transcriptional regulator [Clostridium sp.]